jgi:hypothetical protein
MGMYNTDKTNKEPPRNHSNSTLFFQHTLCRFPPQFEINKTVRFSSLLFSPKIQPADSTLPA